jgi:zinc protease
MRDSDADYPAVALVGEILGGMPSARLFTRVREKEGLSYGAYARLRVPAVDRDASIVMSAIYNPGNVEKVRKVIAEEVEKMGREGVTADEVSRAKDGWLKGREMGRTQDASLAGLLAGSLYAGRTLEFEAQLEQKIRALTAEQVSAAAKKYIEMAKVVVVTAGDFAASKAKSGE